MSTAHGLQDCASTLLAALRICTLHQTGPTHVRAAARRAGHDATLPHAPRRLAGGAGQGGAADGGDQQHQQVAGLHGRRLARDLARRGQPVQAPPHHPRGEWGAGVMRVPDATAVLPVALEPVPSCSGKMAWCCWVDSSALCTMSTLSRAFPTARSWGHSKTCASPAALPRVRAPEGARSCACIGRCWRGAARRT